MTADSPESGTLRQALEQQIEEWRDEADAVRRDPNRVGTYDQCATDLEELLDDHRAQPEDRDDE